MSEEKAGGRKPWSPRIENAPLFINSADYERRLGEADDPPEDATDEGQEDVAGKASPDSPGPVIKPAG